MASTTIGGVKVKIGADITGFQTGLNKTRKGMNQIGKWGAAAAAAVAVGAAAIVKSQLAVLDSLAKTSDALGIQQEKLQALQHIGELTGTSNETVNRSLERMQRNLGMAARMGGAGADALEDLGVSVDSIIKLKPDEQMEVLAVALAKVENQALKASIANDIFGRNGTRMLKMLDQLKNEGLDPTVKALDDMGISLTRMDTSKIEQANDAMFKASEVVTGLANKLTVKLSPILEAIANQFIDGAIESKGFAGAIDSAFNFAIDIIGVFANSLQGIEIIFKTLEVAAIGFSALVVKVFEGITNIIAMSIDGWIGMINIAINEINSVFDTGINEIPEVRGSSFVKGVEEVANSMVALVSKTNAELDALMTTELNSVSLSRWIDDTEKAATEVAKHLTNAITGGGDGGGITKIDTKALEAAQKELENLMTLNDTKLEIINSFELERLALLDSLNLIEQGRLTEHEAAKTEIEANASKARLSLAELERKAKMAALGGMFSDLSSLMNTKSKKLFKIGKMAAISNATLDGLESAVTAWKTGYKVGGPFAAAAFAGASVLKTGGIIQQISSQSFGGASSPVSFSGGLPSVNTNGGGGQSQQGPTNVSIDIVGSEDSSFTRGQIESLIGSINDATGDGVVLNIGG